MIVVIDNYDSFVYNLVQYLGVYDQEIKVVRNDQTNAHEIEKWHPSHILLSPGPGHPIDAGCMVEVIEKLGTKIPMLGVCLGHQAIGLAYGGVVSKAPEIVHGKTSPIYHNNIGVFSGLSNPFEATRYHSLVVQRDDFPTDLEITAWTKDGLVMGLKHRQYPMQGVQFHPESIMTQEGMLIIANFLGLKPIDIKID